ncbi:MAG: hypothetical protein ACRDYV_22330, partial [Acidimicrobiia bacterium]
VTVTRVAALAVATLAAVGCADADATATVEEGWRVGSNPEFMADAYAALNDAPAPDDGWRIGVIVAENDDGIAWEAGVLTDNGMTPLDAAHNCDDDGIYESQIDLLVDPGDLITWSTAGGDDPRVCSHEITVLRKAAA